MTDRYAPPTETSTVPSDWYEVIDGGLVHCQAQDRTALESCVSNIVGYVINPLDLHFIAHIDQWVYSNSITLLTLIVNNL